jgi:hypothetical protein
VLVVVTFVGGVPVSVVQVVDVVAMVDGEVTAVGTVLVVVPLGQAASAAPVLATRKAPTASSTMVPPDGVSA